MSVCLFYQLFGVGWNQPLNNWCRGGLFYTHTITGTADNGNVVTVTVTGPNPEDISATITTS